MAAWAALALGVALLTWWSVHAFTGGRVLAPLDDAYIALAYARNLVHLEPFRFQPGDPPSTGATSLLWMVLLAPLAAAGGMRDGILFAGLWLLNTACYLATCVFAWRISSRLLDSRFALAASVAVALCGHVVWGSFCGLETGLACVAVLALWDAWAGAADDDSPRWWTMPAAASVAAALVRPEGAVWALGAAAAAFPRQGSARGHRARITAGIIVLSFVLVTAAPALLTMSAMPSSGWAKTAWASPHGSPLAAGSAASAYAVDTLKGLWMGAYPSEAQVGVAGGGQAGNSVIWAFPPGALLLFLLGALAPVPGAAGNAARGGALLWAAGWLAACVVIPAGWHHHRYLIPLFPVFILVSFAGILRMARAFPHRWRTRLAAGVSAAWIAFAIPGFLESFLFVGRSAGGYAAQHRAMADALAVMPEDGAVGAVDVGILGYFSGRRVIDLKGLTSPWLFPATSRGWGSLYDVFKSSDPADRPRLLALHPGRPDTGTEQLLRAGILREIASFSHPQVDSRFVLYDADWGGPGPAPLIHGWSVVDEVDCAEPGSEERHAYRIRTRSPEGSPYNSLQVRTDSSLNRAVGDGGWVTNGGEAFTIAAEEGVPLVLLMRTYAPRACTIDVSLNGRDLPRVRVSANPERFQTLLVLEQAGEMVKRENPVRISCGWPESGEYSSYHYWALQPRRR